MKKLTLFTLIIGFLISCQPTTKKANKTDNNFSFVFMTDIHLAPERHATEGLLQAIDTINKLAPDFVLTGGDNIMDALGQKESRADSLYTLFETTIKKLKMPVYYTLGNHEVFGLYKESGVSPDNKYYGKKMYENKLGKRYYSFDHKNWHFVVLDGIGFTEERRYYGVVDSVQVNWLKHDLANTEKSKPVAVCIHIPLVSIGTQINRGPTEGLQKSSVITNAHEIISILEQHNVKLVLQGHAHFLEDIYYNGIHYITGGAVSAVLWRGTRPGLEEGFLKIDISGDKFSWKYIDYGWDVGAAKENN